MDLGYVASLRGSTFPKDQPFVFDVVAFVVVARCWHVLLDVM